MDNTILEMVNITKDFSGVKALDNVSFNVEKGEVHALCGENGAGKSTLMKVLSGVYPNAEFDGEIIYNNQKCEFNNIRDSENLGIVIIHQELALIPDMTIVDNIFLGNEIGKHQIVDQYHTIVEAKRLLKLVGLELDPLTMVNKLSVGQQQLVEIAKAFSKDVKLLILDEPTSALNETESENLLNLIMKFKADGITSIMISHKLNEVMAISDRITVIRDGKVADNIDEIEAGTEMRMVKSMVGRDLTNRYPEKTAKIKEKIFEVKNWTVSHPQDIDKKVIDDVSFHVKAGEVVGVAGLMGSGRTELALSLFGRMYGANASGEIKLHDKDIDTSTVSKAIDSGLAYVTEDRKEQGLILIDTVNHNISLTSLDKIAKHGVIDTNKEIKVAEEYRQLLNIRTHSVHQVVESLSGGNQQKVVLSKWLMSDPEVLILDEPTRGIDVGAKYEIYKIIDDIASAGKAVILISSDLPELLGMADRVYAINEGKIGGEVDREHASEEIIMKYMLGISEEGN